MIRLWWFRVWIWLRVAGVAVVVLGFLARLVT